MFEAIKMAEPDPILGLSEKFNSDPRQNKINLGIGVYKDEKGTTPILACVKRTESFLLENEKTKNYLSIEGNSAFATATQKLLFGDTHPALLANRIRTAQTPGGTGALRVAADFLKQQTPAKRIWISNPTWPNHLGIFKTAGFETLSYRYYDAQAHALDFENMLDDLKKAQSGDIVLFHGCCHNPTGIDPTPEQWQQLAKLSQQNGWFPLFDFAYQGLGLSLDEDASGLRAFAETHDELLVASSYSKNFGLYNERVGAISVIAKTVENADHAFSQIRSTIRVIYSNPPAHGGLIVAHILNNPELKQEWIEELTTMRERIQRMRILFAKTLLEKGAKQDFSFITQQKGMFSFSGLTQEQVLALRNDHAIYAVNSGRINVAGMTLDNMSRLCEAIVCVL